MSRPHLSIELAGCGSLVRGYGSRDLVEEVSGRPPVWMSRLRGWSIQEWTARKVVALAETRGYDITIIEARSPAARTPAPQPPAPDFSQREFKQAEPEAGLW